MEKNNTVVVSGRNYQIDVLKLFLAILVLLCHTFFFVDPDSVYYDKLLSFGWMSVHIFFIISGFLMVKGVDRRKYNPNDAGKYSMDYVTNKIKSIALPCTVSTLIILAGYILIIMYMGNDSSSFGYAPNLGVGSFDLIIRALPEILGVNTAGFLIYYNTTIWYISAMLIVMLPLSYILIKNRDFFIYVLAPIVALMSFGFMYNHHNDEMVMYKIVQAISGLSFGVVAWIIYKKLVGIPDNKIYRIIVTVGELLAGGLFFYTWIFHICDQKTLFCAALLLPIIIAIAFSNKSYISRLFQFKWMQYCGSLSLAIFLNHWVAVLIANALMKGKSYWFCLVMIVVLTVVFSVINFVAVKIIKAIWNKVLSAANKLN